MIKLQKMFDEAEVEEKVLEAEENKSKEKEELQELMESAVGELQADIKAGCLDLVIFQSENWLKYLRSHYAITTL